MIERIVTPRLADIVEAIERIRGVLDGITLEDFEQIGKSAGWSSAALRLFPKLADI